MLNVCSVGRTWWVQGAAQHGTTRPDPLPSIMPAAQCHAAGEEVLGEATYDALDINRLDLSGTGLGVG